MRFSDAPSWEALEDLVRAQQAELGWQPADLEAVRRPPLALFQLASECVPPLFIGAGQAVSWLASGAPGFAAGAAYLHVTGKQLCCWAGQPRHPFVLALAGPDKPAGSAAHVRAGRRARGEALQARPACAGISLPAATRCHMRLAYERVHVNLAAGCVQRTAAHRQWGQRGQAVRDARGAC